MSGERYYMCFHTERRNLLVLNRLNNCSAYVFSDSDFTMKLDYSSDVSEKLCTLIALMKGRDGGVRQLNNKQVF